MFNQQEQEASHLNCSMFHVTPCQVVNLGDDFPSAKVGNEFSKVLLQELTFCHVRAVGGALDWI